MSCIDIFPANNGVRYLRTKRYLNRYIQLTILLFFLLGDTAYANPRPPSTKQLTAAYTGVGLALACEVLILLLAVRRYHYRVFPLGLCLFFVNVLSFTGAFMTPFSKFLLRVTHFSDGIALIVTELCIVAFETAALFYLVKLPFIRSPQSRNISLKASLVVTCLGNLTSFATGFVFVWLAQWIFWR